MKQKPKLNGLLHIATDMFNPIETDPKYAFMKKCTVFTQSL